MKSFVGASALLLLPFTAAAQSANVSDGDTLKLRGTTYRLWGIDAPEAKQTCPDGWPAGRLAISHLQSLIAGRSVTCQAKDSDRYGRTVAVCFAGGVDLGERMVRDGYAWALVRYSQNYVDEEVRARSDRRGVHAHGCVPAWEWRLGGRQPNRK
jgi:endonuclease YncB( thermonuclease family)